VISIALLLSCHFAIGTMAHKSCGVSQVPHRVVPPLVSSGCGLQRSSVRRPDDPELAILSPQFLDCLPEGAARELKGKLRLRGGAPFRRSLLEADLPIIVRACKQNGFFLNTEQTFGRRSLEHPWPDGVSVRIEKDEVWLSFDLSPLPPAVRNRSIDNELLREIERSNLQRVQSLLDAGANPNAYWKHDYLAIDLSRTEYLPVLLRAMGWQGRHNMCSQIFYSQPYEICRGHAAIVQALLKAGADPNGKEGNPQPISIAVQHSDPAIVRALLAADAAPKLPQDWSGLLLAASKNVRVEAARMLIERGAPIDARDRRGQTALALASQFSPQRHDPERGTDQLTLIQLLLYKGAAIDSRDHLGLTPLMCASQQENDTAIEYLTRRGANTSLRDLTGKSAADHAEEARASRLKNNP
jgi:ankyrin repeat protein